MRVYCLHYSLNPTHLSFLLHPAGDQLKLKIKIIKMLNVVSYFPVLHISYLCVSAGLVTEAGWSLSSV